MEAALRASLFASTLLDTQERLSSRTASDPEGRDGRREDAVGDGECSWAGMEEDTGDERVAEAIAEGHQVARIGKRNEKRMTRNVTGTNSFTGNETNDQERYWNK